MRSVVTRFKLCLFIAVALLRNRRRVFEGMRLN